MAFLLGAVLSSYLILRLLMYGIRKVRQQQNGTTEIAIAGFFGVGYRNGRWRIWHAG